MTKLGIYVMSMPFFKEYIDKKWCRDYFHSELRTQNSENIVCIVYIVYLYLIVYQNYTVFIT